jgi:murein L,D-transpeptidase YcbB/YkuD
MHSTPAHELFARPRRAFSHGCIRVSDPSALAMFVLKNAATPWDDSRIAAAMQGPASTRVELKLPIRVMILYATAQATEAGPIEFFGDLYGHDRRLEGLLGLAPVHGTNALR